MPGDRPGFCKNAQPVQQAVNISGIFPWLNLAQPNKATQMPINQFDEQTIKPFAACVIEAACNVPFYSGVRQPPGS